MLWDLIRDFFVQHVFGGVASNGSTYYTSNVPLDYLVDGEYEEISLSTYRLWLIGSDGSGTAFISMGDWLSTTATAIAITIIVVLCCMFIYKIVKLIGGLIR